MSVTVTVQPKLLRWARQRVSLSPSKLASSMKVLSVYNGIFNLLILQGARDWMTGKVPQQGDLDHHHIGPASWEGKKYLRKGSMHTILNRMALTADTNCNVINDRLPNEYLSDLIASSSADQVRDILASHFISLTAQDILLRDQFGPDDYEASIAEHKRTIIEAVENLLIKEKLHPSIILRELDRSIEETELSLRQIIAEALVNDPEQLPPHIAQKLDESIQEAAKKNIAVDVENFHELGARPGFADLRKFQDIITSKATRTQLDPPFANKETLSTEFGQPAELRNGIRHSRTVDEITRKEGEVAILWFKEELTK